MMGGQGVAPRGNRGATALWVWPERGTGTFNALIVSTTDNTIYAYDADKPTMPQAQDARRADIGAMTGRSPGPRGSASTVAVVSDATRCRQMRSPGMSSRNARTTFSIAELPHSGHRATGSNGLGDGSLLECWPV